MASKASVQLVCILALLSVATGQDLAWWEQAIDSPYGGLHTGVKLFDINDDGYSDIFYSAGRNSVDQSYIRINLGFDQQGDHVFSDPIPIGDPGSYYQVDVAPLSSLHNGHVAVLLVGGTCSDETACQLGAEEPAVILDVSVTGCSAAEPSLPCRVSHTKIWEDASPEGDRNGAFEMSLGDGVDPVMAIVGKYGIKVFEPSSGVFPTTPTDHLTLAELQQTTGATIRRATSIATGYIGDEPALLVGVRTGTAPNPLIAVHKTASGSYDWTAFASNDDTYGNGGGVTEGTGLALGDLNGDGMDDIVEASFLSLGSIEENVTISQNYFLWNSENSNQMMTGQPVDVVPRTMFDRDTPSYKVAMENMYRDSRLPDIVHAMVDGRIKILANLGTNNGIIPAFREAADLSIPPQCQIRDIAAASLAPCTMSIVTALLCYPANATEGNYIFTADTDCSRTFSPWPTWSPTASSWPTMSSWPTQSPPTSEPQLFTAVESVDSLAPSTGTSTTSIRIPTSAPSASVSPTSIPTSAPSASVSPTSIPTSAPSTSTSPTSIPTLTPTSSKAPTSAPSAAPSVSSKPSILHSASPSITFAPSTAPSLHFSASPSSLHSSHPTLSNVPTGVPSDFPSLVPSSEPSISSDYPSLSPSTSTTQEYPSLAPSNFSQDNNSSTSSPSPSVNSTTERPTESPTIATTISTSPPTRAGEPGAEKETNTPTSRPDPFVDIIGSLDLDGVGTDDNSRNTGNDDESDDSRMWQFAALGLSLLMIVVGCAGIIKVTMLARQRKARRKYQRNQGKVIEEDAISLYLEEDEIDALEKR